MSKKEHLRYYWIAKFNDESTINQFNEDGSENLFKLVEDNKDNLTKFTLFSNEKKNEFYEVDLVNKTVSAINNNQEVTGSYPKLVYFRRNTVRGDVRTGNVLESKLMHVIGLETDDDKKVIEVTPGFLRVKKKVDFVNINKNASPVALSRFDITKDIEGEIENVEVDSEVQ